MATQLATKASTITYEQSMVLIKNMVRISISSICYMRDLFPDDCFTKKTYGTAEIHQLQGAKENNGEISITHEKAFLLTQWLEQGVFEALQEQYLNTMTFAIYCNHPITGKDLLLETYEFKVAYQQGSTPAKINNIELNSKDAVKAQAIKFIRQLTQFTDTLDALPVDRWITLTLTYRDNTPPDYEPKYFKPNHNGDFSLSTKHLNLLVDVGSLKTSSLEMKVKFSGLESLLFEDLCKIGIEKRSSLHNVISASSSTNKPSILRSMNHSIARSGQQEEEDNQGTRLLNNEETLAHTLNKLDMKNTTSPFTTQNSQESIHKDSLILNDIKKIIFTHESVTTKVCASKLNIKEDEVKKLFEILIEDGIIKRQGRGYQKIVTNNSLHLGSKHSLASNHNGTDDNNDTYNDDCMDDNQTKSPVTCISNYGSIPHAPMKSIVKSYENKLNNTQLSDDIEDTYQDEIQINNNNMNNNIIKNTKKQSNLMIQNLNSKKQLQVLPLKLQNNNNNNNNSVSVVKSLSNSELKLSMNNLKRDLQEIGSSQQSDYSEIKNNRKHKKCSVIREPIYLQNQ